jgi:cytochrome c553
MKKTLFAVLVTVPFVLTLAAQQAPAPAAPPPPAKSPSGADISWAFAATNGALPAEPPGPMSLPGSSKSYTRAQIDDLSNPPDWFPDEHPTPPSVVVKGHDMVLACGACHLMSGHGHPESADLSGLPAEYIRRTMMDFKSGVRVEVNRMNTISKGMTNEEIQQAADYFSALKPAAWTEVKEATMVPKTFVGGGRMRYASPEGGTEPLGNRIITLPADQSRVTKRDPHSGFVAYVPVGSIKKGETLVKTGGGKSVQCGICHGETLRGLGNVPRLAGRHPGYIARQLYMFKDNRRNGGDSMLMKRPVASLTDDDILNIAAYLASLPPA